MINEVFISAVGAVSSVGLRATSTAAAVRAGISGFGEHSYLVDRTGEPMIVAQVPPLSAEWTGIERLWELTRPALLQALAPLHARPTSAFSMIIALPAERPGLPENLAAAMKERFDALEDSCGAPADMEAVCCGHAGGLMALNFGARKIDSGELDLCLIGGVDSYLHPETLEWLDYSGCLHSPGNPWGFVPGEAAAFCLLAGRDAVERLDLPVAGQIIAAGVAHEENTLASGRVCIGSGLTEAFGQVLEELPSPDARIGRTICDLNGERHRGEEFGFAVARTASYFREPGDHLAPAGCWGDTGAASGPLFCMLAVTNSASFPTSMNRANSDFTLLWSSSSSGERSASIVVAERPGRIY